MLVLHVHIQGRKGNIERTYDFLRNDDKEELSGCDIVIPYKEDYNYPLSEQDAIAVIRHKDLTGEH